MTPTLSGHLSNQIFRAVDDKKLTAMELIYFSKAFDTICHSSLLQTLRNLHVGRSSQALKWFESYLTGRGSLYGSVPHYRVNSQLHMACRKGLSWALPCLAYVHVRMISQTQSSSVAWNLMWMIRRFLCLSRLRMLTSLRHVAKL